MKFSGFRAIVDSIEQAVIFIDERNRIAYCNPPAARVWGLEKEKGSGTSVLDLHPARSHSQVLEILTDLKSGKLKQHIQKNVQMVDGRSYDTTYSAVRDLEGRCLGVIVTSQDVTERKKVENELTTAMENLKTANEEMKHLDRRKNEFFSNVSHELKTPMVSVIGYVDMMLQEKGGPLTEQQRKYLETSYRNLLKLEKNIDDLLELAEHGFGKKDLPFELVDLRKALQFSCSTVQPLAANHRIELVSRFPQEPVWISGVEKKLNQLFDNLLSNAIKYNRLGGKIEIDLMRESDLALVRILDTGIGIPRESLKEVFKRYFQEKTMPLGNRKGLGIGLSLVQEIVELHQGKIYVESEVGKGSIFTLLFPVTASSPPKPPVSPA